MQIPISEIYVPPRIRKVHPKVKELALSLKENGQIQAIAVRPINEDERSDPMAEGKKWALVAGGRRLAASIFLGWEEIRGDSLEDMSPYRRLKLELEENLQRESLDPFEEVETKARLHELYKSENPEHRLEDTAAAIGESVSSISRDLRLAEEIKKNPNLKRSGSKKAAMQAVKMADYATAKQLQEGDRASSVTTLQERIITSDMRDWLRAQPDASVDLIASDFPYGIEYFDRTSSGGEMGGKSLSQFDDSAKNAEDILVDAIPQLLRVTDPMGWIVLMLGWESYFQAKKYFEECCVTHFEYEMEKPKKKGQSRACIHKSAKRDGSCKFLKLPVKPWIWYRPNSRNNSLHPDLHAQNQYEIILVVNRGEARIVSEERIGNVLMYESEYHERVHAHQKPIELWKDIIERLSLQNAHVVDVCYGSGSALAAAADLSRRFSGCDLNPAMRDIAIGNVSRFYKGEVRK